MEAFSVEILCSVYKAQVTMIRTTIKPSQAFRHVLKDVGFRWHTNIQTWVGPLLSDEDQDTIGKAWREDYAK